MPEPLQRRRIRIKLRLQDIERGLRRPQVIYDGHELGVIIRAQATRLSALDDRCCFLDVQLAQIGHARDRSLTLPPLLLFSTLASHTLSPSAVPGNVS